MENLRTEAACPELLPYASVVIILSGSSALSVIAENVFILLLSNSLYRAASFANFEGILGFSVPSII